MVQVQVIFRCEMDPKSGLKYSHPSRFDVAKRKVKICTFWADNKCMRGPECAFAHGTAELRERSRRPAKIMQPKAPSTPTTSTTQTCQMTPDKLDRDCNTKEQGVKVNSITALLSPSSSDSEEVEFLNHRDSTVAEEAKIWEHVHSFAFEFGIVHKVKVFISDHESACHPRLLTHLGIRALVSIKHSVQARRRCPSNVLEYHLPAKRCGLWTPSDLVRTYAKFYRLRQVVGNIMFWSASGTPASVAVVALFALSVWPHEDPGSLLQSLFTQAQIQIELSNVAAYKSDLERWQRYIHQRLRDKTAKV